MYDMDLEPYQGDIKGGRPSSVPRPSSPRLYLAAMEKNPGVSPRFPPPTENLSKEGPGYEPPTSS